MITIIITSKVVTISSCARKYFSPAGENISLLQEEIATILLGMMMVMRVRINKHGTSTSRCAKPPRRKSLSISITYAYNHSIPFLPAIRGFSTSGRIDAESRLGLSPSPALLPRSSGERGVLSPGQLAQPNQDYVFSKRAAFFNGLKRKVGHIMEGHGASGQPQSRSFYPLYSAQRCIY